MKVKEQYSYNGDEKQLFGYGFTCPGCGHDHVVTTKEDQKVKWNFNGDVDKPTFTPSLLATSGWYVSPDYYTKDHAYSYQCHSFITDGKIQFLSDCSHALAGQTVDLPEIE